MFVWDPATAEKYRAGGCTVLLWRPAPRLLVTHVTGPGTLACLQFYTARAERAMQAGALTVFHDWAAMTGYEPAARDLLKQWGRAHNPDFVRVTYLVQSKVIAMLISVAALTLGRELKATTDRTVFLRDLELDLTVSR